VRNLSFAAALTLALVPAAVASERAAIGGASGEPVLIAPMPQSWGGSSSTAIVVGVGNIVPPRDTITWDTANPASTGMAIYQTSTPSGTSWIYQLDVPSGALLERLELEACDTATTGALNFGMTSGLVPGGNAADITTIGTTGVTQTPGCAFFPIAPTAATTIDNSTRNYWIYFFWSGTTFNAAVNLHSFRVYYRLQVSPAPAVATFPGDVPTTHPFFRFVEAMAASGLTGGCGAGTYCPDAPVTRGQLAVFLSVALGLHFPN
jgi:hypothetical protein